MKGVTLFLADGFEDIEAIAPVDILLRGDVNVMTVSINDDNFVTSSHGIPVLAQYTLEEYIDTVEKDGTDRNDIMIFPGGLPGSVNLAENKVLMDMMRSHYADGGSLAAICAAPAYVLTKLGKDCLDGVPMTCYEGCEKPFDAVGAIYTGDKTTVSGRIITGNGPGNALAFGLEILGYIKGRACADKVKSNMMIKE